MIITKCVQNKPERLQAGGGLRAPRQLKFITQMEAKPGRPIRDESGDKGRD